MKAEQEFENLRRLLKLKRYEKPPPRFFNDFSGNIIARLRAGVPEDSGELPEDIRPQSPWLERVLGLFQSKPVFAGGFGAAVCLMLVGGVALLERVDSRPPNAPTVAVGEAVPDSSTATMPAFARGGGAFANSPSIAPVAGTVTNSIFDMLNPSAGLHQVSWTPGSK